VSKVKAKKRRMTRKELREPDKVLSTMEQAVEWMGRNRRAIFIGVLVALVGAGLWGVYQWRTGTQSEKAAKLYKKGIRTFTAIIDPSVTGGGGTKSGAQVQAFQTKAYRAKAALKIFDQVVNKFEGYPISRAAHLYRGNCYFDLKKYAQAITAYKKVLSTSGKSGCGCGGGGESSDSLKALALENLGYAQTAKGRLDQAGKTFARLRSVDKGLRRDWAYWHQAVLLEAKGDLAGAIKAYEKVRQTGRSPKGKNPDLTFMLSPLNDYSTKRARYLKMKLEDRHSGTAKRPKPGMGAPKPDAMGPATAPVPEAMTPAPDMGAATPAPAMGAAKPAPAMGAAKPAPRPAMGAAKPAPRPAMGVSKPAQRPALGAAKPAPRPAMARP
jgi:predicted negative regulator of RcsB-dependent stress response